jgi:hypothetical protein
MPVINLNIYDQFGDRLLLTPTSVHKALFVWVRCMCFKQVAHSTAMASRKRTVHEDDLPAVIKEELANDSDSNEDCVLECQAVMTMIVTVQNRQTQVPVCVCVCVCVCGGGGGGGDHPQKNHFPLQY